jgi:hypothetical protein
VGGTRGWRLTKGDVEASEDSAFLLTLSWPPEKKMVEAKPAASRLGARNEDSGGEPTKIYFATVP